MRVSSVVAVLVLVFVICFYGPVTIVNGAPPAGVKPLTSVAHDATLTGEGTTTSPLGVADVADVLTGTWTGDYLDGDSSATISLFLTLTQQGHLGTGVAGVPGVPDLSATFEGSVTFLTSDAVFIDAHLTVTDGNRCSPSVFTGSLKADLVQGTLVGNISGIQTVCGKGLARLTLRR